MLVMTEEIDLETQETGSTPENILQFCIPLPEKTYLHDDLKSISLSLIKGELSFISFKPKFKLHFLIDGDFNKIIASVHLEYGKIIGIEQQRNISQGETGQRITYRIADVPIKRAWEAINNHFGKAKSYKFVNNMETVLGKHERVIEILKDGRQIIEVNMDDNKDEFTGKTLKSLFRRNKDMVFDLIRITDGLGTGFKPEDNLNCSGKYAGYSDEELSNNIMIRSLSEKELPYHLCIIPAQTIKLAFDSLSYEFYANLLLWFMPEQEIDKIQGISRERRKQIKEEYEKWKEYKNFQSKDPVLKRKFTRKARNMLNVSIEALRDRIEMIQSHE